MHPKSLRSYGYEEAVQMFDQTSLMPHARCWAADPRLIWTMVVTNAIIFLSYAAICSTLLSLVRKTRHVIARDWAWFCIGFALFIVACGSTHFMDVVTTWVPLFWLDAATCIVTAVLSATVAVMLMRRVRIISFSINDYADRLANTEHEKQRMQESLLAARKLEDWSRMSTSVAHEINNPLEAIQNLLYLIGSSEGVSNEVVELAKNASEEADRVMTISRSALSFFRQTAKPEVVDLRHIADSVRLVLDQHFRERSMLLHTHFDGNLEVRAFPGEARQVILNLVRNAVEATTQLDKAVQLTMVEHRSGELEGVKIVVADEGLGMEPAVLVGLFEFGKSTKGEQGNGMGLWTVKHIVKKHGGDIQVASTPGKGTQFTLWWPREFEGGQPIAQRSQDLAESVVH